MGGHTSHHHHHTDTASQQKAAEAQAAAAAAQAQADALQGAFEEQRSANERLFAEQRVAQQQAAEQAQRAHDEFQRQLAEAQRQQQADVELAARRLEEQRQASARMQEQARQDAIAAAQRLEEAQRLRVEEAARAAEQLEAERVAAELRVQQELQQERARVHAEKLAQWRALNREYPIPEFLKPYIAEVRDDVEENAQQDRRVNVAVLGNSGTGKSSLLKVILEHFASPTDETNIPRPISCFEGDGTCSPTPYNLGDSGDTVKIWDLPGQGTASFPAQTYLRNMGLKYFDAVLVIVDGRLTENDLSLLQAIQFATIWHKVVRTKVDQAVEDGANDHGLTQEQSLERVRHTLSTQLQLNDPSRLHLVTTRKKYWVGFNGNLKFGTIDELCDQVTAHVEAELEHGRPREPAQDKVEAATACRELAAVIGDMAASLDSSDDDAHREEATAVNLRPLSTPEEAAQACFESATVAGDIASTTLATGAMHDERPTLLRSMAGADAEATLSPESTDSSDLSEGVAEVVPEPARTWLSRLFCSRRATTTPKRRMQVACSGLIEEPVLKRIRA